MFSRRAALTALVLLGVVIVVVAVALSGSRGGSGPRAGQPSAFASGSAAASGQPSASAFGSAAAGGRVGPAGIYPDPKLTPGDVIAGVTAQQVCTPGYATSVRNVSVSEKRQVYARYGERDVPGAAEVDHFISLELGGSNAVINLWPERYSPTPGAHEKDRVEDYLHAQVCSGALTLQQAQDEIRGDWYAVYQQIAGR